MTNDEIDALSAGAEMNRTVHESVFGRRAILKTRGCIFGVREDDTSMLAFKDVYIDPDDNTVYPHNVNGFTGMIPNYSTRIADAMRIVDLHTGNCEESDCFMECWSDGEWFVASHPVGYTDRSPSATCDGKKTGAPSLALAICRWGLKKALQNVPNTQAQ